jgi:hypothetical protein
MSDIAMVALVTSSGPVAIGITALLLNYRLVSSLRRRIEVIEADLMSFLRTRLSRVTGKQ